MATYHDTRSNQLLARESEKRSCGSSQPTHVSNFNPEVTLLDELFIFRRKVHPLSRARQRTSAGFWFLILASTLPKG